MAFERTIMRISCRASRADAAAEGQQLPAIGLHAEAADEHEIEYEEQHDQIDGERGQAADEPLREFRDSGQKRLQVALLPEVVARTVADEFGHVAHGVHERLRIERDALDLVHYHPDQQGNGDEETAHSLDGQQCGRRTAPPPVPSGQHAHLPAQQDIDGRRPEQSAQEGHQAKEDRYAQRGDQYEERITPVLFSDRQHIRPTAQGACRNGVPAGRDRKNGESGAQNRPFLCDIGIFDVSLRHENPGRKRPHIGPQPPRAMQRGGYDLHRGVQHGENRL